MLTQSLTDALNAQLTRERSASAVYLDLSGQFALMNLTGFQHWAREASRDETRHADELFDYLVEQNVAPLVDELPRPAAISKQQNAFMQTVSMLTAALTLEKTVTEALNQIYAQAQADEDNATQVFLQPFLTEQVSAEHELETLIGWFDNAGGNSSALLLMDLKLEGKK